MLCHMVGGTSSTSHHSDGDDQNSSCAGSAAAHTSCAAPCVHRQQPNTACGHPWRLAKLQNCLCRKSFSVSSVIHGRTGSWE